jgi:serine/threonine protein kinase
VDSVYDHNSKLRGLILAPVGQPALDTHSIPNMVLDVLTALQYAHGLSPGLAHCDVRPTNIIYVPAENKFYLIDWGLGAQLGTKQTSIVGDDAFLRDDILKLVIGDICTQYYVQKCHDFASLAYCVVSVHSCGNGALPWPSYALPAEVLLAERIKCMAAWRETAPVELVDIVDTLLSLVDTDPLGGEKLDALMQKLRSRAACARIADEIHAHWGPS